MADVRGFRLARLGGPPTILFQPEKKRNGSSARLGVRDRVENGVRVRVPVSTLPQVYIRARNRDRVRGREVSKMEFEFEFLLQPGLKFTFELKSEFAFEVARSSWSSNSLLHQFISPRSCQAPEKLPGSAKKQALNSNFASM